MASEDTTQRALGRLEGQMGEVLTMLKASTESRARMHERVDEMSDRLGKIEGDIGIAGQIDAQVRNELDALRSTIEANRLEAAPAIEAWQDVLKTGKRVSWVFGIAGITTIGGLLTIVTGAWEWLLKLVLRH